MLNKKKKLMKRKVSYSQYPLLRLTKSRGCLKQLIERTKTVTNDDFFNNLKKYEDDFHNAYSNVNNIAIISRSYLKAIKDSTECIANLIKSVCEKENYSSQIEAIFSILKIKEDTSGIFIIPISNSTKEEEYIRYYYYHLDVIERSIEIHCIIEIRYKKTGSRVSAYKSVSSIREVFELYHIDDSLDETKSNSVELDISILLYSLIFKEIAETEIEIIEVVDEKKLPKGLSQLQRQVKMNALPGDITIDYYSANWYTEIIREEGFKVRGHFRNQPYKDGYRMIFIKPFEKKGYHRKAEKDKQP